MKKILALDLGTMTGVADNMSGILVAKTVPLATPREIKRWGEARLSRRRDPRIIRLHGLLSGYAERKPDIVVFEDVQFGSYTLQCQLWASFRAVVWLTFSNVDCVAVGTLKKFATGNGAATKPMMRNALTQQYRNTVNPWPMLTMDDNAVDAAWLFLWAQTNLART